MSKKKKPVKSNGDEERKREKRYNGLKDETSTTTTIIISVHLLTCIYNFFKTTNARRQKGKKSSVHSKFSGNNYTRKPPYDTNDGKEREKKTLSSHIYTK